MTMTKTMMTRRAAPACVAALLLSALAWALPATAAEPLKWLTDVPAAQARAKSEHKLVFLDFTGSDWCPVCAMARKEVFSTKAFADYAASNLVLVEVDFPERKPQSDALKAANKALAKKYAIEGFPSFIVLDTDGKQVGRLEYEPGKPESFLAQLEKLKAK